MTELDAQDWTYRLNQWKAFTPSNGDEEALRRRAIRMFSERIREARSN